MCRSIIFCPKCHKCPHCCSKSSCRGQTEPALENLGCPRGQSQCHKSPQGSLLSPLLKPTNFDQVFSDNKWLCQYSRKQLPVGGIACTYSKEFSRKGHKSEISGFLQSTFLGVQTGPHAFPLVAILGKVVEKLQDYLYSRIILILSCWPNMPCFGDLMAMSSQILLYLPSLLDWLTQPFNQILHRNLSNLNLHA